MPITENPLLIKQSMWNIARFLHWQKFLIFEIDLYARYVRNSNNGNKSIIFKKYIILKQIIGIEIFDKEDITDIIGKNVNYIRFSEK